MSWLPIVALALAAFALAVVVLRLPRASYGLFGATLLFGLSGYALQGSPGMPDAPGRPAVDTLGTGPLLVEARREFFDPDRLPARYIVTADAFTRRGQYEDAANFLRNAVLDNPRDAEAWVALGNALVEHADGELTPAAIYAFAQARDRAPDNPAAGYFYGLALLRAGEPGQTRAIWAELLADAPADAPWRADLAARLAQLDAIMQRLAPADPASPPQ